MKRSALALFAAAAACSGGTAKVPAPPPVPVVAAAAALKTVAVRLHAIGRVQPRSTVPIRAQVSGQLLGVHFQEGQDVKKGDPLFTIDARPFEAEMRLAEANLAKDAAKAEQLESQLRRYESITVPGAVSKEQLDGVRAEAEGMRAALLANRARVESTKLQVEFCTIRSPVDGRTGGLTAYAGSLVKALEDPVLVVVNQIRPIDVTFSVAEQHLPEIRRRAAEGALDVVVVIPDEGGPPIRGALTFVDNSVDPTTGMIRLKGTFANDDGRLWPGQFVEAHTTLGEERNAVVVPSEAVQTGQKGPFLFVVKADLTVEARPVTTGRTVDGETVIASGLAAGERVVRDGQIRLVPGARVDLKETPASAPVSRP